MRSCERPRKSSPSEAPPSSVSNRYCLSSRTHGSSCRRRASSSLRRVSSFSAFSSSSRAASHCSCVPVACWVIVSLSYGSAFLCERRRILRLDARYLGPERARLDLVQDIGEDAGVNIPAGHDGGARFLRHATVDDDEQHVLAAGCQLVRNLGIAAVPGPGVREQAHGLEARDDAVELARLAVLVFFRRGLLAGEFRIIELEADLASDTQVELAGAEPFRALVGLGDVSPHALDRSGQQALELDGAGLDHGDGSVHLRFLFVVRLADWEDLAATAIASSARSAASRWSRRSLQNSRVRSIHCVSSSKGFGSRVRKWSRPATRRRTSPARSSKRMCFDTELSEISKGAATSVTRASPDASWRRILRRVSSARAIRVSSSCMRHI